MTQQDFTTTITVDRTPQEVFEAILDVRGWWSRSLVGDTTHVGDEFVQHAPDLHWARLRVSELDPGRTVVWQVLDSLFTFVEDAAEWRGTEIRFDLTEVDGGTRLRFTHVGLFQGQECYGVCANAWGGYIGGSLRNLILTGTGSPNVDDVAKETGSRAAAS